MLCAKNIRTGRQAALETLPTGKRGWMGTDVSDAGSGVGGERSFSGEVSSWMTADGTVGD